MQQTSRVVMTLMWGFLCLLALYGCNGDDNDNSNVSQAQVTDNAVNVINRVLDILFGDEVGGTRQSTSAAARNRQAQPGAISRQEPVEVTISCGVGEVSFNGEATVDETTGGQSFALEGTITFANCEGINGNLNLESTGTVSNDQVTITATINNTVSVEGCSITFADFSVHTSANTSGTMIDSVIANGSLIATCDGETITCTVNNIDVNDREAFADSCQSN